MKDLLPTRIALLLQRMERLIAEHNKLDEDEFRAIEILEELALIQVTVLQFDSLYRPVTLDTNPWGVNK